MFLTRQSICYRQAFPA